MHYKWIQIAMEHDSVTLSPWVCPCVYSNILYSFSLFINTLLVSLLSIFVGILSCKAEGPGPFSLTDHWSGGSGLVLLPL